MIFFFAFDTPSLGTGLFIFCATSSNPTNNEARANLAAGHPVVYCEPGTRASLVIKEYLNGQRELVRFESGYELVVSPLPAA